MVVSLFAFYFWGSSSFYPEERYEELVTLTDFDSPETDTVEIITFNIGYLSGMDNNLPVAANQELYEANMTAAKKLLMSYDADIIAFQEIDYDADRSFNHDQLGEIGNAVGAHMALYNVNWDRNYLPFPYWPPSVHYGKVLSGQGILTEFEVIESERVVLPKPESAPFYYEAFYLDRLIQVSILKVGNRELAVMNIHLEAFDKETRELQAGLVLDKYKELSQKYPVLLVGDFNSRPPYASEIIDPEETMNIFLNEPSLTEIISKEAYLACESCYFTFDTGAPYERLDYIFYSNEHINPIEFRVMKEAAEISDHLPIYFKFSFN